MANTFTLADLQNDSKSKNTFTIADITSDIKNEKNYSLGEVPLAAIKNIPSSGTNMAKGIYQAVRHPLDTGMTLWDAAAGGLHNALPKSLADFIDANEINLPASQRAVKTADAIGSMYKKDYGTAQGFRNKLATDPLGVASDAATVLSGGAAGASKIPGFGGVASAMRTTSNAINPINAAARAVGYVAPKVGNLTANVIGNFGTHTGGETIKQAFKAGVDGGDNAADFIGNMRGTTPMSDVLDKAKANISEMVRQKTSAYKTGMADVSKDKAILDFSNIDKSVVDAGSAIKFKGQIKDTAAAQVQQKIADAIAEWKRLDPAEYHTPEGLDALKQQIGGIVETIPFEQKTAGMVGKKIYNSVKDEITKQAPTYAETMKGYSEASDQIREIERALSQGNKASADTALRKLQSVMRNNANTNYGNRMDLVKQLENVGGNQMLPSLAGQALSGIQPRGLQGLVSSGLGMGGYMLGGAPVAAGTLAVQSPRLMGELAHATGKLSGIAKKGSNAATGLLENYTTMPPSEIANYLYQLGKLPQQQ